MTIRVLQKCSVDGCCNYQRSPKVEFCNRHDIQLRRHGRITDRPAHSLDGEQWVKIKECAGYEISSMGRVRSVILGKVTILKNNHNAHGHFNRVTCGRGIHVHIHTEVARAFLPNPFGDTRVVFLDGDKTNCKVENLQWVSVYCFAQAIENLKKDQSQEAQDILHFMEGDKNAMNGILQHQTKRLSGLVKHLITFYRDVHGVKGSVDLDSVVQDTLLKAILSIKRGLLRNVTSLNAWFACIARNTLINSSKKSFYCGIEDLKFRERVKYA